jgi:hypothetical protein
MSINSNWPRWLFASITTHFDDALGSNLPVYVEGTHRTVDLAVEDFCEVRIDGPNITELSKDYYKLYVEINILVTSHKNDEDFHRIHTNVGLIVAAFSDISLYKYGDDDTALGCANLVTDHKGKQTIAVHHFGQIDPDKQLLQSTVEGHYVVYLRG